MSNHMTGNSKHRLLKKQIFTLSAAFVFVISALTGSSYYANKRESEILAKNRTEMLASLSDGLGSSAASDTGTDSAASDEYINKVQTISANKGVVVFATSEPKKVKKLADDETTVTYGSLTLADFKTEKKAEKVIDSMKDSNVLMALGTTEFYIQGDPEETPAVDETVKGNGNSPLVALIDTGDNNADSSVNLTKDSDSDVNGHGTSMDAIIRKAANGNVRILSIKAMNDDGTGTLTNIAAAIRYAVDNGADIINMSIAAKADDNSRRVMQALVDEAAAKNIKVVAAVITRENNGGVEIFATQRGYGEYKDWWEFPGGKIEEGETPEEALIREIAEELDVDISIDDFLCSVEYDYPEFHLSMDCFLCHLEEGEIVLLEHEAAKWLDFDNLYSVQWLPADDEVLKKLERTLLNG